MRRRSGRVASDANATSGLTVRLGILGGSFDPPHVGHLLAASDAFEALALDQLIFIPASTQPLKVGMAGASPTQRLRMTRLLVTDDGRFSVDPIEIERQGLSYTVDTLAALADSHAGAELFFLVGTDVLASFDNWREPARVAALARLTVLLRSGELVTPPGLGEPPLALRTRRVDVSATEIRERVRAGKSIRGFVPESVREFIATERLYR